MTLANALWPDQLTVDERAWLSASASSDRRPDILVVGGGILGVATAVACRRARLGTVSLVEREPHLAAGASGGAAGLLCPEAHVEVDPPELVDLARLSLNLWREFEHTLQNGVGLVDIDWLGLHENVAHFDAQSPLPANTERIDVSEVERLVPGLVQPTDGILVHHQARVNPVRAIARMASTLASTVTGTAATAVSIGSGRISRLHTTDGDFEPGVVVFATGLPPRVDGLSIDVPAFEVKGHIFATEPTALKLPGAVAPLATSIEDGRLLLGGTLDVGDAERVVRPEVIAGMWSELEAAWPAVKGLRISHQWACFRPAHPDYLPVADRIQGLENAWFTSGHYKTGILMAPATARAIATWIASGSRPPEIEILSARRLETLPRRTAADN